jgi:L-ascorbate 6-phosphate lactonase
MAVRQLTAPRNLPGRVEHTRVERGTVAVWHLGGAGMIVKTPEATIYVDPYVGDGAADGETGGRGVPVPFDPRAARRVDAVLCTHDHSDHTDQHTLTAWRDYLTPPVFGPAASTDLAREWGYPAARLITLAHGASATVNDVQITATRAYDPLAKGANAYLLKAQGITLLHLGDSLYFAELGESVGHQPVTALFASVGHNPPGKHFYMTESDAARAARDVNARILVPIHWDLWRNFALDPRRVVIAARWYCPQAVVKIPRYGRKMVLGASASAS